MARRAAIEPLNYHLASTRFTDINIKVVTPPEDSVGGKLEMTLACETFVASGDDSQFKRLLRLQGEGKTQVENEEVTAFKIDCSIEGEFKFSRALKEDEDEQYEFEMTRILTPMLFDFCETILFKMGYRGISMPRYVSPEQEQIR